MRAWFEDPLKAAHPESRETRRFAVKLAAVQFILCLIASRAGADLGENGR
jgi:hypothetical protein